MKCPSCGNPLTETRTPIGLCYQCSQCGGRCAALAVLRKAGAEDHFLADLWRGTFNSPAAAQRTCPLCDQPMNAVLAPTEPSPVALDVCRRCQAVWFDRAEFEALPHKPVEPEVELPPQIREQLAVRQVQEQGVMNDLRDALSQPRHNWFWLWNIRGLIGKWDSL